MKFKLFVVFALFLSCRNNKTSPTPAPTFNIDSSSRTLYWISDSIDIDDGKNDVVRVFFQCTIDRKTWDSLARMYDGTEERLFYWIANGISQDAKYKLNNPQSFQPFKKQFLLVDGNRFICQYGLFGRNGIGNMVEGNVFAEYKPLEDSMLFKYKH